MHPPKQVYCAKKVRTFLRKTVDNLVVAFLHGPTSYLRGKRHRFCFQTVHERNWVPHDRLPFLVADGVTDGVTRGGRFKEPLLASLNRDFASISASLKGPTGHWTMRDFAVALLSATDIEAWNISKKDCGRIR
jgi:hypothetical protein